MRISYLIPCAVALCLGSAVYGDGPKPFPEFSAKRIKPPKAGSAQRITIQIDPSAPTEPTVTAQPDASVAVAPKSTRYDWFWTKISPDASAAGPGRLHKALAAISGSQAKVAAPRLQTLQDIAASYGIDILRATINTEVSPALVLAVIAVESGGDPVAVSGAGAQGLMQLMPDTAARFDVADSLVAKDNIKGGVAYLNWLMGTFENDPMLVLAGYNAGEGSVRKHNGVPPFAETRDYVPMVLAAFQVVKGMCLTPPELISDGCVFAVMK